MGKILDLSVFDEETLDLKTADGHIIHLKKPTQALAIAMLQLRSLSDKTTPEAALAIQNSVVLKIMNNNADGIAFTPESVAALTLAVKNAIVKEYADFASELQANPTASSLQSPVKPETKKRSCFAAFMPWRNTRG